MKFNKLFIGIVTLLYYLVSVLPHEKVGILIAGMVKGKPREFYDNAVSIIAVILLMVLIAGSTYIMRKNPHRIKIGIPYLIITLGFMFLCLKTLIIVNVEMIHFVQYAILATLLFHLTRNHLYVILIALLAGAIDEGYQYFHLSPERTMYFDFNDVILDVIGAGLGLTFMYLMGKTIQKSKKIFHAISFTFLILGLIGIILLATKVLSIGPSTEATYLLQKEIPENFWSIDRGVRKFHIMSPLEGTVTLIVLVVFYSLLNYFSEVSSK